MSVTLFAQRNKKKKLMGMRVFDCNQIYDKKKLHNIPDFAESGGKKNPKKKHSQKKRKKTTNFEVWGLELICLQTDNQKTKQQLLGHGMFLLTPSSSSSSGHCKTLLLLLASQEQNMGELKFFIKFFLKIEIKSNSRNQNMGGQEKRKKGKRKKGKNKKQTNQC